MEEFDSVTGDYDFDARRMDPLNSQFIQPDSVIQNVYDPQSLNHYAFERNNPYKYEDENGQNYIQALGIAFLTGLVVESTIQVSYAGDLYSPVKAITKGFESVELSIFLIVLIESGKIPLIGEGIIEGTDIISGLDNSISEAKQYSGFSMLYGQVASQKIENIMSGKSSSNSYDLINTNTGSSVGSSFSMSDLERLSSGKPVKVGDSSYKIDTSSKGAELVKVTPVKSNSKKGDKK